MAKVELDLKGLQKLKKEIQQAAKQVAKVGVLAGATYPSGVSVSKVAEFLEYGWTQPVTAKQRGWFAAQGIYLRNDTALRCPPRPFFRATKDAKEKSWREKGNAALKGLEQNPKSKITQALTLMGLLAQQDLQDAVMNGAVEGEKFAARSECTLRLYASQAQGHRMDDTPNQTTTDKPLYRSGLLAASLAFNIENGSKN